MRGLMSYYKYHVFFCTNKRENGRNCCHQYQALELRNHAKAKTKALGIAGPGGARINTAGCMDRCDEGPVIAVYPQGIWYTYVDQEDIDEIIEEHLVNGRPVKRLMLDPD